MRLRPWNGFRQRERAKLTTLVLLGVLLPWLTGCQRASGDVEFEHAKNYDVPIIHRPPENSSKPIFWENPPITTLVQLRYPYWAKSRVPFSLLMRVHVNEDGVTQSIDVISEHTGELNAEQSKKFVKQTVSAVGKYRFEPLVENGVAKPYTTIIGVTYLPKLQRVRPR
jgi:hypothetical protein